MDIACVIAFGCPDKQVVPYMEEDLAFEIISANRFGRKMM